MDNNNSIFVQAKIEYTKQLVNTLKPQMYDGIKSIYDDAKEIYKSNSSTSLLFIFRTLLEKIPEWNNELILNETDRIIECSKCDWLDELVTAVYISHTKILMSIGNSNSNKINLTIPKLINFIHKCYINIAREIWKNPLLFSEDISGYEYQKNMNVIESIICNCIENTIRISLPVKEILKEHLDINDSKTSSNSNENKLLNELKELLLNSKKQELVENNENKDEDDVEDDVEQDDEVEKDSEESNDKELEEEKEVEEEEKELEEENLKPKNIFVNNSDYESPDEETINGKVENIEINDIPDISTTDNTEEPVYDNPDIIDNPQKENDELYQKLIKIKDENDSESIDPEQPILVEKLEKEITIPDKKEEEIKEIIIPEPVSVIDKLKEQEDIRGYGNVQDISNEEEQKNKLLVDETIEQEVIDPLKDVNSKKDERGDLSYIEDIIDNKEQKEILSVNKKDDDTETIDLFYNDLKELSDKKGLTMETVDEDKYTLFDDL
tara:strand:+ start:1153 stop:2643 length:1491 start_codon:yes stop_codon:yes gene_type:complete